MYKYEFQGKDAQGHITTLGYILPKVYNRTIAATDTDYTILSVYLSPDVVYFPSMKAKLAETGNIVVLNASGIEGESHIWHRTVFDDSSNVLDIKYVGTAAQLRLKLTIKNEDESEIGQIIAQKYDVDLSYPRPLNGYGSPAILHQTDYMDLAKFTQFVRTLRRQTSLQQRFHLK